MKGIPGEEKQNPILHVKAKIYVKSWWNDFSLDKKDPLPHNRQSDGASRSIGGRVGPNMRGIIKSLLSLWKS